MVPASGSEGMVAADAAPCAPCPVLRVGGNPDWTALLVNLICLAGLPACPCQDQGLPERRFQSPVHSLATYLSR